MAMETTNHNNNNNTSSSAILPNVSIINNSSTWNLDKMETNQIPMVSGICNWPNNCYLLPISSSSSNNNIAVVPSSSSSGSLSDILGVNHNNNHSIEEEDDEEEEEELGAMKEMMYRIACMQPVNIDPSTIRKPKRRNVRISDDPQSVAARHRRERISEKIRILQRLVPGGTKMDTASMLDEAIRYVKFLKRQIKLLQITQQHPSTPQPQCFPPTTTPNNTFLLAPSSVSHDHYWPFAPNILLTSTTASASNLPTGVGFHHAGGHAHIRDGSSNFNQEVIGE